MIQFYCENGKVQVSVYRKDVGKRTLEALKK